MMQSRFLRLQSLSLAAKAQLTASRAAFFSNFYQPDLITGDMHVLCCQITCESSGNAEAANDSLKDSGSYDDP